MDKIKKIANNCIFYMKGYKSKLKGDKDKILAEQLIKKSKKG